MFLTLITVGSSPLISKGGWGLGISVIQYQQKVHGIGIEIKDTVVQSHAIKV